MTFAYLNNSARSRHFRNALIVVAVGLLFPALSYAAPQVTPVALPPRLSPSTAPSVAIFQVDSLPSRPYEILGHIYEFKARLGAKPTLDRLLLDFVAPAQALGADGIIGLQSEYFDGGMRPRGGWQGGTKITRAGRWASGMAVRFLDEDQTPTRTSSDLVMGILPIQGWSDVSSSLLKVLGNKGYYGRLITNRVTLAALKDASAGELAAISGTWAETLLHIDVVSDEERRSPYAPLTTASRWVTLEASLYSVTSRSVVWETRCNWSIERQMNIDNDSFCYYAIEHLLLDLPEASRHQFH